MKVLWLCNTTIPTIAKQLNIPASCSGGWLAGAASALSQENKVHLSICFPLQNTKELIVGECEGIQYYGYPASQKRDHIYDEATEKWLKDVVNRDMPDLVHIWGTEYPHALAMTRVFNRPEQTVISIQGLCCHVARHYYGHMKEKEYTTYTLRDFICRDFLSNKQKTFEQRGLFEREALQNVRHVIGRTRWDRASVKQIAPHVEYHYCAETLRTSFYENMGKWSLDTCQKHSIFVSQANYPLKGFHLVLEALVEILKKYPDAKLFTTGSNPFTRPYFRQTGYKKFVRRKIEKLNLKEHVCFLGNLNAEQMCQRYLDSHVFVSASSIENSPNSVGEAMLLGVPTVASYVGGTMDLLADQEEGLLYQSDAPYMLAAHVCSVFDNAELASKMGRKASIKAQGIHDSQRNLGMLLDIYLDVCKL